MSDLVLKTRVAVTKRNLERIRDLGRTLSSRATDLRNFLSLPSTFVEKIDALQNDCGDLLMKARQCRREYPDLYNDLNALNGKLDQIYEMLESSRSQARSVRRELFQFEVLSLDVQDFLARRAVESANSLTEKNYFAKREQIESFFSEYVDLLRGIALRSAGFHEQDSQLSDIFRIADNLPRLWGSIEGWEWHSLAVPSYTELNRKSQAMMLRLGFPEWTLWALPFVQNEFAHVYVARRPGLTTGLLSPYSTTLLADALASIVTGPAYACAALLLRLDPAAVTEAPSISPPAPAVADPKVVAGLSAAETLGSASITEPSANVALRSATIIHSLERVAGDEETPLTALTRRLRAEWYEAVKFAGGHPHAFEEALKDSEVHAAVQMALEAVLGKDVSERPAWANHWATIGKWAQQLRDNHAEDIALEEARDDQRPIALAFLLDAAWLARVGPTPTADAPENELDTVASGAIQRMLDIAEPAVDESADKSTSRRPLGGSVKVRQGPL